MIDHRLGLLRIGVRRAAVGGVAAVTLLTGTAQSAPITVNNHSFQSQTLANDDVNVGLVSWAGGVFGTSNGRVTWNPPGSNAPDNLAYGFIDASGNGTPLGADGSNVFTIFGGDASSGATIYQDSATLLAAGTAYTMSVAVGRRANGDASNWTFGLMANNQSISGGEFATNQYLAYASGSAAELTSGRFLDKTLSITLESGNAAIGRNLRVVLSARGGGTGSTTSTGWDNVRLFQSEGSMVASTTQPLGTVGVSSGVSLTFAETASFKTAISGAGGVRVNAGTVTLGGVNTYTGATRVTAGTLVVNGSVAGDVTLAAGSRLGGTGSIAGAVGGAGIFGPGTSPGITTTGSIDPSGGLGFEFEVAGALPAWANPTASVNDVIRITGGTPFASALTAANRISILLGVPGLDPAAPGTYTAGFFTDTASDFTSFIEDAVFDYWVAGEYGSAGDRQQFPTGSGGSPEWYTRMSAYDPALSVQWQVVPVTADFGAGDVNGYSTQFVIVPEPGTLALASIGVVVTGWAVARRRRRAS